MLKEVEFYKIIMKRFIQQILFFFVFFGLIFLIGIFLPITPRSENSMLQYKIEKDSLLRVVPKPRIIFIGGSNLVFGLNSRMIKDSLRLNPVNAGLAINLGLIYMMDDVLPYIKRDDIVVLAPEYNLYYGNKSYGGYDLFKLLMDVDKSAFLKLRFNHIPNLIKEVPNYFLSKFKMNNYSYNFESDVYGKHIFNEYGDSEFHWNLTSKTFSDINPIRTKFNYSTIREIIEFDNKVRNKGATLMITYPSIHKRSLEVIKRQTNEIQEELEKTKLKILGTPQRYSFPDSLIFDQVYHLTKTGVDNRTHLLICDIKAKLE